MGTGAPQTIPVPLSSFPGATPQESAGRLINCYSEPLGDPQQGGYGAPKDATVWRRAPGLTQHAMTAQAGYRGGLIVGTLSYEIFANQAFTVDTNGTVALLGALPGTKKISIARNQNLNFANPDVIVVDLDNGAYVLISAGVVQSPPVPLTTGVANFPVVNSVSFQDGYFFLTVADGRVFASPINSVALSGSIASLGAITPGSAYTNGTYNNVSLTGGAGTGAKATIVVAGNVVSSVTITNPGSGFLTGNSLSATAASIGGTGSGFSVLIVAGGWNGLTFTTLQAKSDVTLLRGIAYQGYMFFFTTGDCEVWTDQANPAPAFPYGRSVVLAQGLIQSNAIAGFETGFDDLMWVAQDFGVWRLPQNSLQPVKISPPDLDRLIEASVKAADLLEAGVGIFAGRKTWTLQSSTWSWSFNLATSKWFERSSLQNTGAQGRWRGVGGHPAFGKWLMGDVQSGAIVFLDDTNYNDATIQSTTTWATSSAPMLMRIESGLVDKFPMRTRIPRADFHFVRGTGQAGRASPTTAVTGAAAGTGGVVRLAVISTFRINAGDTVTVANILGTTEANGANVVSSIVDATHLELQGVPFVHAYVSGGTVTDVTPPPANVAAPTVAVSWADDGGVNWKGPVFRSLGPQAIIKTGRVSVKNTGMTGVQGRRWRLDVSDAVYTAFLKATQSDNPTEPS